MKKTNKPISDRDFQRRQRRAVVALLVADSWPEREARGAVATLSNIIVGRVVRNCARDVTTLRWHAEDQVKKLPPRKRGGK